MTNGGSCWPLALAALSCALSPSWARVVVESADQDCLLNEPGASGPLRVCYYTTWARYRPAPFDMAVEDWDPRMCSHLIIAFAWITEGRLAFHSEYDDKPIFQELVRFKKHYPRLKVLAAVGGWNFGSGPFRKVVGSEESRRRFVESSIEFMETWSLDGLDLDWEYPEARERDNLTALIVSARFAFDAYAEAVGAAPLLLTAAVPAARTRMAGYDVQAIAPHLDFVNIMAYDLHGPWDKKTGHNAPMASGDGLSVPAGVEMWAEAGMPRHRMVVGMPTYGHSFQLAEAWATEVGATAHGGVSGTYTRTSGFFAFYEVCEFLAQEATQTFWDEAAGNLPYAVLNDTWLSYDNEASLAAKVDWVTANRYGGIMIWSLALDDFGGSVCGGGRNVTFPLLRAINARLGCQISGPVSQKVLDYVTAIRNAPKPWEKKVWWTSTTTSTTTTTTTTTTPRPTTTTTTEAPVGVRTAGAGRTRKTAVDWAAVEERVRKANLARHLLPKAPGQAGGGGLGEPSEASSGPAPTAPHSSQIFKVADECDWENDFRRGDNCSHFVRCERGLLHSFTCPPGLAFHEGDSICRWPRFVPDCVHLTTTPGPDFPDSHEALEATDSPPQPSIPPLPSSPLPVFTLPQSLPHTLPQRQIHYHFEEVLGAPTAEQEAEYQVFKIFHDAGDLRRRPRQNVFSVFRGFR